MTEKNVNEMPSGQTDEKILVLEEKPSKGQTVGRTTVLTDGVRDLIKSGSKKSLANIMVPQKMNNNK